MRIAAVIGVIVLLIGFLVYIGQSDVIKDETSSNAENAEPGKGSTGNN